MMSIRIGLLMVHLLDLVTMISYRRMLEKQQRPSEGVTIHVPITFHVRYTWSALEDRDLTPSNFWYNVQWLSPTATRT